jgi:hypothetical protein
MTHSLICYDTVVILQKYLLQEADASVSALTPSKGILLMSECRKIEQTMTRKGIDLTIDAIMGCVKDIEGMVRETALCIRSVITHSRQTVLEREGDVFQTWSMWNTRPDLFGGKGHPDFTTGELCAILTSLEENGQSRRRDDLLKPIYLDCRSIIEKRWDEIIELSRTIDEIIKSDEVQGHCKRISIAACKALLEDI